MLKKTKKATRRIVAISNKLKCQIKVAEELMKRDRLKIIKMIMKMIIN